MVRGKSVFGTGYAVLKESRPLEKMRLGREIINLWRDGRVPLWDGDGPCPASDLDTLPTHPARPERPKLVPKHEVPSMKVSGVSPPIYILVTMAHIELTAVDSYWDTLLRFPRYNLPCEYYQQLMQVIDDESM